MHGGPTHFGDRRRLPLWAGCLLLSALAAGCGGPGGGRTSAEDAGLGWTRHDLRQHRPAGDGGESLREQPYRLGEGISLDRRRRRSRKDGPTRLAGEVLALEGLAGRDFRWPVPLGDEPFLSYVPLSRSGTDCRRLYRVRVVTPDGVSHDVHTHPAASSSLFAPAVIELGLEPFAGRQIELVLRLDAEGGCAPEPAVWGSPAVYSRRHVEPPPGNAERPNVILLGLDTLRADALGAYGRQPSVTPALDRLAAESDVWLEAFSCFNVTNPSFASILTGLYGKNHGVYDLRTPLGEEHTTLAELFAEAGYATAAFLSARHLDDHPSGLAQGFSEYEVPRRQGAGEVAVDRAIGWISDRREPFFLWLHLFDPHTPHTAPEPYASGYRPADPGLGAVREWLPFRDPGAVGYDDPRLGGHRDLYTAEVAYLDRQIGRLLDFLRSRRLLEHSVIALVADHGENLGEHEVFYRHSGLWDTTTRVPLMIRWPGRERAERRIPGLVQTIDLFPTLAAAAGLEAPPGDGADLREVGRGRRLVFAEVPERRGAMVRTPDHLFFWAFEAQSTVAAGRYLYDLRDDPAQEVNLAGQGLEIEATLANALRHWLADRRQGEAPEPQALTEEEVEQLRALGYVD